jgi:hypothetical protein
MNGLSRMVVGVAAIAVVIVAGAIVLRPVVGPGGTPSPTPIVAPSLSPGPTMSDAACRLLTSVEVRNASGNPGLGAQPGAAGTGARTSCIYTSGGGDIIARTDLTNPGGASAFASAQAIPGVVVQEGLGVDAVYDPATATMYVLKGDAMAAIKAGWLADSAAKQLAQTTALAQLVVARL